MPQQRVGRSPIEEQPGEGSSFNLKNIRTLLTKGFTNEELRRLCYDNSEFRPVYEQLAEGIGKDRVIDKLIEYAERKELLATLLAVVKEFNPARYEKHQPYYDVITEPVALGDARGKAQKDTTDTPDDGIAHHRRPGLPIATIVGGGVVLLIIVGVIFFFIGRGIGGNEPLETPVVAVSDDEPTDTSVPPLTNTPELTGKLAFTSDRDGNSEIYVMNVDGSGQTNLTNNLADDFGPAWSPDGSQIAFVSNRDGNGEIYVMNADGSSQTNLTNNPANDFAPAWSP